MIHVTARRSRARKAKMSFHYTGPYRITEKKNRLLYKVTPAALPEATRRQQRDFGQEYINIGRLKKYYEVPPYLQRATQNLEEVDIPAEQLHDYIAVQQPIAPPANAPEPGTTEQQMMEQLRVQEDPVPQQEEEDSRIAQLAQLRAEQERLLSLQEELLRQ